MNGSRRFLASFLPAAALCTVVALAALLFADAYLAQVAFLTGITVILVLGESFAVGNMGQLLMCQAGFYGIGAYVSALLEMHGMPPYLAPAVGIACGAVSGLVVGLAATRIRGHYLAIVTLAIGVIVEELLNNLQGITNGPIGLVGVPTFFGPLNAGNQADYIVVVWGAVIVVLGCLALLRESRFGWFLRAIRDSEAAAESIGLRIGTYQVATVTVAAAVAGLAGALYTNYAGLLVPDLFSYGLSAQILATAVLGGINSFGGAVVSSLVFNGVPQMAQVTAFYQYLIFGVVLIVMMQFAPRGLSQIGVYAVSLARRRLLGWGAGQPNAATVRRP